jgi:hypothetical protein
MRTPLRSLSLVVLLIVLAGCAVSPADLLFSWTGEEEPLGQARGALQLTGNLLRPRPRSARYEPVAHAGVNPFGINVFLEQEVEPWKRERSLQMIADAGFHWIRQEFPWEDIEIHDKGDYEDRRHEPYRSAWEKYDHIVGLAEQYELGVIARLSNPPAWSRADGDARGAHAPPDDFEDFGDYVYTVVSRYRGRIRYYQIWNEPNIYPEWGEQPVDPVAYTRLLCLAYQRAMEADPDAVILTGALAQTIELSGRDLSDVIFLQRMYQAGAGDCFDILAVNDYMLWSGPTDHRLPPPYTINYARPVFLRDVMVANGDASKPIWISEMNSNALPNDPTIQDWGRYGQVTLEQQARYAPLAYQRAMEEWPWVGVINLWFFKRASDAERNQSWYYFRMVEPDFTPMPVYEALQDYTAHLVPTLYAGTHQEDHWALTYEGEWQTVERDGAMLGAYRRAERADAAATFTFEGSSVTLIPGPDVGEIAVTIDDKPPVRLPLDGRPVRLFSSRRTGSHSVYIAAVAGQVGIDSVRVLETSWGWWWLAGLLAVGALSALARLVVRRHGGRVPGE